MYDYELLAGDHECIPNVIATLPLDQCFEWKHSTQDSCYRFFCPPLIIQAKTFYVGTDLHL